MIFKVFEGHGYVAEMRIKRYIFGDGICIEVDLRALAVGLGIPAVELGTFESGDGGLGDLIAFNHFKLCLARKLAVTRIERYGEGHCPVGIQSCIFGKRIEVRYNFVSALFCVEPAQESMTFVGNCGDFSC